MELSHLEGVGRLDLKKFKTWLGGGGDTCMHLIPAVGKQRQADICELKASLIYRANGPAVEKQRQADL